MIIGEQGVGKTSFVRRLSQYGFRPDETPTTQTETHVLTFKPAYPEVEAAQYIIKLIDTEGRKRYDSLEACRVDCENITILYHWWIIDQWNGIFCVLRVVQSKFI